MPEMPLPREHHGHAELVGENGYLALSNSSRVIPACLSILRSNASSISPDP